MKQMLEPYVDSISDLFKVKQLHKIALQGIDL